MRLLFFIVLSALLVKALPAESIAYFYALDADAVAFQRNATPAGDPVAVGTRSIQRFQVGNHIVCMVRMQAGAVETAISAEALLSRFQCDMAVSTGPAGALSTNAAIGQWYKIAGVTGWQRGSVTTDGFSLSQDAAWRAKWGRVDTSVLPSLFSQAGYLKLASGEAFVASTSEGGALRELTRADAIDMNTFGLAKACENHDVPLFCWRVISDGADEEASEAFRRFSESYAGDGGDAVYAWIAALPQNPSDPESYPTLRAILKPAE